MTAAAPRGMVKIDRNVLGVTRWEVVPRDLMVFVNGEAVASPFVLPPGRVSIVIKGDPARLAVARLQPWGG